jgi:hypothetical protein
MMLATISGQALAGTAAPKAQYWRAATGRLSEALGAVRYRLRDTGADSFDERPHWEVAKVVIWRSVMR